MHTGGRCIASERSWQTALLSSVFLFSSSWLREKSRVPAELGDGCAGAAALRFLPALPSHPGRGIVKRPALPRSPAMVSCKYLILSLCLYFCLSLSPLCGHILEHFLFSFFLFFPLPIFCFHFDLHEELTTFPSVQAAFSHRFSNVRRRDERSRRKGSSLSVQNHDQLFAIPAVCKESRKLSSWWDTANV